MARGHPRCRFCNGRGGWQAWNRWHTCKCVRGNRITAKIIREGRERLSGQKQLTMDDMRSMGSSEPRGKHD